MVNVTIYIHIWHTWILWGMTWRCLLMDLDRDTDSDVGPTKNARYDLRPVFKTNKKQDLTLRYIV